MPETNGRRLLSRSLLEMGIVIVSILVAFSLDAWWDGKGRSREELAILEAMQSEFELAKEDLQKTRQVSARVMRATSDLLDRLRAAHVEGRVATVPDTLLIPLMIAPTTDLGLGTLDGLRTSGGIQDLRNAALRLELGRWQGVFDEAREEDDRSRRLVTEQVGPVLRRYIDMAGIWTAGLPWAGGRLTPEQLAGTSDLPANNDVSAVIAERLIYLEVGQREFEAVSAELDRILALLDSGIAELR